MQANINECYRCDLKWVNQIKQSEVKRFNVLIPSRIRLIGRRRPNSRIYSRQRQVPIWEIRKTTPALAGTEFRTTDQSGP